MDFNKIPRLITDQISTNHTDKLFNIGFKSGEQVLGFALLPEAAKGLAKMLHEQVASYEKQYGEIDDSRTLPEIQSPIQMG